MERAAARPRSRAVTAIRTQLRVLRAGRAGRQLGPLLVGRVFEQVALGVVALVVAARLGPEAFAPVGVLLIVNSAAVTLSDWGLGLAVLRRCDGERLASRLRRRMHTVNGSLAVAGVVAGALVGGTVGEATAASGLIWWASSEAFVTKAGAVNSGRGNRAGVAEVLSSLVFLALVGGFAFGSAAVAVVGAGLVVKHGIEIVVAHGDAGFARDGVTEDVRSLWATQVAALGVANVDYLLVGLLLGAEAFSIYSIGYRIAVGLPSVLAYVGTRTALTDLGNAGDPDATQRRYVAYVRSLFGLGAVVAVVTALVGAGLAMALGPSWELVWPTVLVLACSAPWRMVFGQAGALALVVRQAGALVRWQVVQLGAFSVVIAVAALAGGLGCAVATVAIAWMVSTAVIERRVTSVARLAGWPAVRGFLWLGIPAAIVSALVAY